MFLLTSFIVLLLIEFSNQVTIDTTDPLAEVDPRFLSVSLDSHLIAERWKRFDFKLPRVLAMASSLSPSFLRLGGTAADLVTFVEKSTAAAAKHVRRKRDTHCWCATDEYGHDACEDLDDMYKRVNFTLTGSDWIKLNEFCRSVGWKMVFDFNVLRREVSNNRWDNSNARKLLSFSSRLGYSDIAWQLGNEPNSFPHSFGVNLTGEQLGKDFFRLRKLLSHFPLYENSTLVGPDINQLGRCEGKKKRLCEPLRYLKGVLKTSRGVLDAITWHHYYLDGHTATKQDFLNISVLDNLRRQTGAVSKFAAQYGKPVWLGETSSAYGGGAKGISDRYVASFSWLDKLGSAAAGGLQVVVRQSFYHGCYSLLGEDLLPNPDFWISLLHKRLVGTRVLKVKNFVDDRVRLYAHCSLERDGSVVLFGLNLAETSIEFRLELPLSNSSVRHYVLSPGDKGDLSSRRILLNGHLLELKGKTVPQLSPRHTGALKALAMRPWEMAFWVFDQAGVGLCQS